MLEIKPPSPIHDTKDTKIFVAGSIEMNAAERWQEKVARFFDGKKVLLMNPRRDHWDNSWTQSKEHPKFREQVEWELDALGKSDYILMYFDPATKSPVTLLELGLYAQSEKIFVACPEGFWRKGNVDIVCTRYGILQFPSLDALLSHMGTLIH